MTTADGVHNGFASEMKFGLCAFRGQRNLLEDIFMRGAKTANFGLHVTLFADVCTI